MSFEHETENYKKESDETIASFDAPHVPAKQANELDAARATLLKLVNIVKYFLSYWNSGTIDDLKLNLHFSLNTLIGVCG